MKKLILLILSLFLIGTSQAQIVNPNPPGSTNWASPGAIGSITPNNGKFTYLTTNEVITGLLNQGAFSYGTLSYTDINISASFAGNQNNYFQHIIQNVNAGTASSADYIVSNNLGTASTYYGDFGITSSGYNTPGQNILNQANTVYFQSQSADVAVGTLTANNIHFVTNLTDQMDISSAGVISGPAVTNLFLSPPIIGQTTPAAGYFTNLRKGNGSAASPSDTFTGAGTTGMYWANPGIGFSVAGVSYGTITSAGFSGAVNMAGGAAGSIPYQSGVGATTFLPVGTNGYILQTVGGLPSWQPSTGTFNPAAVAITGGSINGTSVGLTTPSTGLFTTDGTTTSGNTGNQFVAVNGSGSTYGALGINPGASTGATTVFSTGTAVSQALALSNIQANTGSLAAITITNNTGAVSITGTNTNNNAAAGQVGEFVTATGSTVALTSGSPLSITSVSLSPGDWDIEASGTYLSTGATTTVNELGISATTNALPLIPLYAYNGAPLSASIAWAAAAPMQRALIASTTTYYCVMAATFAGGTATGTCTINARRRR